ncbi:MAG TPA: PD-(D/E)XK nuclease family protein [Thermoanaerobaculia bacterium]|nr:PD-(D/E)XK nuclease family protein [Thermoanaerobaculia bacterium]
MPDSRHSPIFDRVAAVCREHPLREKIVVVPSLAIGHQIADRIAHEGTPWVNLRPETIRTLADAVAGEALVAEGRTVLSRAQALALVEGACTEAFGAEAYFAQLADRPGLHRAMQRSIDDLRMAGVTAGMLGAEAFEDPRKAMDLRRVLAAYERELEARAFVDRCGVVVRATEMLARGTARPWGHDAVWVVIEEEDLSAVEKAFLGKIVPVPAGGPEPGGEIPAGRLRSSGEPGGRDDRPRLSFVKAVGEENEIRAALRAVFEAGAPFDSVELVYTTRDPHLALAYELTSEYAVQATFAEGVAVHFTRPGRAAVGLLRWMETWEDVHLRRLAVGGALDLRGGEALAGPGFARLLREAAIGWGRGRHLARLDALERETLRAAEELEIDESVREARLAQAARVRRSREIVRELLEIAPDGERIAVAALAAALGRLVDARAAVRSEIDGMAKSGICRTLEELAALPGEPLPRVEASARLRDAILALHVGASNPRPGLLHVAPVRAAGWSGRPRLFVVGLEESKHPGSGIQDPVLLDAERERLNASIEPRQLPLLGDRPRRTARELAQMLERIPPDASLTLSWPSIDLRERRERFPAQALLELWREAEGKPDAGYEEMERSVPRAGFLARSSPLSMTEWWLPRRSGSEEILRFYPSLAEGERAEAARNSAAITRWDGKIDAPPEEVDPRKLEKIYSASQLEAMAKCPYSYFLSRILDVEPLDALERGEDWLTPMEYGSLFHDVLETFMREVCARGEKPGTANEPRLVEIATAALARKAEQIPPPGEAAFQARRDDLIAACAIFLRAEERDCGDVDPKHFEVSFGFAERVDDGFSMPEPLELPLADGERIRVRGRIDRVDHHPASQGWHVWDYKSGSTWGFDRAGSLSAGTKVQHAIYARALEAMLRRAGIEGSVLRSGYYFPTVKGRGQRIERTSGEGELERALGLLFDTVGSGYFPHADADRCRFCDFHEICGGPEAAAERAERKHRESSDDPAVLAWRRLQEIE